MERDEISLVRQCQAILEAHRAEDVSLIDLRTQGRIVDFFLIATATSEPHLRALKNHLEAEVNHPLFAADYRPDSGWCAIDLGSIIVHLLLPDTRRFYDLESAINQCPRRGHHNLLESRP